MGSLSRRSAVWRRLRRNPWLIRGRCKRQHHRAISRCPPRADIRGDLPPDQGNSSAIWAWSGRNRSCRRTNFSNWSGRTAARGMPTLVSPTPDILPAAASTEALPGRASKSGVGRLWLPRSAGWDSNAPSAATWWTPCVSMRIMFAARDAEDAWKERMTRAERNPERPSSSSRRNVALGRTRSRCDSRRKVLKRRYGQKRACWSRLLAEIAWVAEQAGMSSAFLVGRHCCG